MLIIICYGVLGSFSHALLSCSYDAANSSSIDLKGGCLPSPGMKPPARSQSFAILSDSSPSRAFSMATRSNLSTSLMCCRRVSSSDSRALRNPWSVGSTRMR